MTKSRSNKVCSLLFNHQFVEPTGFVKPCCRFKSREVPKNNTLTNRSLSELFNNSFQTELRKKSLSGEHIEGCKRCMEEEASGKKQSLRQYHNNLFSDDLPLIQNNPSLQFLEIGFGNICNLKCRMCDSRYSSKWVNDENHIDKKYQKFGRAIEISAGQYLNEINNLTMVKFTGGEPLISKEHLSFLKKVSYEGRSHSIHLNYSTNCTILPPPEVVELWKEFKKVEVVLSIDGFEKFNEFIRHPSKWNQVNTVTNTFLEIAKENSNIYVGLRGSIGVFSLSSLIDLVIWWNKIVEDSKIDLNKTWTSLTHVSYPEYLSPQILPGSLKSFYRSKIEEKISQFSNQQQNLLTSIVSHMLAADRTDQLPEFVNFNRQIDLIRSESTMDLYPEFSDFWLTNP